MQFPARRPFPHAEGQLRMRTYVLRVRRASSACGQTFSACEDPAPHAGVSSPRAETLLRMRRYLLGVRRLCSACGALRTPRSALPFNVSVEPDLPRVAPLNSPSLHLTSFPPRPGSQPPANFLLYLFTCLTLDLLVLCTHCVVCSALYL